MLEKSTNILNLGSVHYDEVVQTVQREQKYSSTQRHEDTLPTEDTLLVIVLRVAGVVAVLVTVQVVLCGRRGHSCSGTGATSTI